MTLYLNAAGYATDKSELYLKNYQEHFSSLVDKDMKLLELGIHKGGSLLLWRDYFKKGKIVGLDPDKITLEDSSGRIIMYQGLQQDCGLLDRIRQETAQDGFDIIIDDASHIGSLTRISFWHLFEHHLKPGGIYVIEDWRTGYWDAFIDGKQYRSRSAVYTFCKRIFEKFTLSKPQYPSHHYGLVGVVKELVDELGMDMITNPKRNGLKPQRFSKFKKMLITPGQIFITKATQTDYDLMVKQSSGIV